MIKMTETTTTSLPSFVPRYSQPINIPNRKDRMNKMIEDYMVSSASFDYDDDWVEAHIKKSKSVLAPIAEVDNENEMT